MEGVTLSPWGLFMQAGPVVKFVMMILFAASIWCWVIIIEALVALRRLKAAIRAEKRPDGAAVTTLLSPIFVAAADGLATPRETPNEARLRIAETMTRAARAIMSDAERGLPNLAVISSVAPFIGLFGTVWGIMTSFAGIAEAKETSLAIVAPGIAEALAATAYGLAAAIPASIGYNRIGAAFGRCGEDIVDLIESRAAFLISRNLTRIAAE